MVNEKNSPSVKFVSNYGKDSVDAAHVDFPDKDGKLSVHFSIGAIRNEAVKLSAYVYKKDKSVEYDPFREPYGDIVAQDEIPMGDFLDLEAIRGKGIVAALKKAKFKGNDNSLNNLISDAQKITLKAWSEKAIKIPEKGLKKYPSGINGVKDWLRQKANVLSVKMAQFFSRGNTK